jgi:hypothetical protein
VSRQRSDPSETRSYLGPLFDPEPGRPVPVGPLHSDSDKTTSAIAAAELKSDPQELGSLQAEALQLVREFPGRTCKELASLAQIRDGRGELEWHRQRIGRRLSELERAGLVHPGDAQVDPETHRQAVTWWPCARQAS